MTLLGRQTATFLEWQTFDPFMLTNYFGMTGYYSFRMAYTDSFRMMTRHGMIRMIQFGHIRTTQPDTCIKTMDNLTYLG